MIARPPWGVAEWSANQSVGASSSRSGWPGRCSPRWSYAGDFFFCYGRTSAAAVVPAVRRWLLLREWVGCRSNAPVRATRPTSPRSGHSVVLGAEQRPGRHRSGLLTNGRCADRGSCASAWSTTLLIWPTRWRRRWPGVRNGCSCFAPQSACHLLRCATSASLATGTAAIQQPGRGAQSSRPRCEADLLQLRSALIARRTQASRSRSSRQRRSTAALLDHPVRCCRDHLLPVRDPGVVCAFF